MILVPLVIVVAVLTGFLAGGSLRPFDRLRLHWWGAAFVGLALQAVPFTGDLGNTVGPIPLLGSYVLLLAFAWVNHRLPALWLVFVGLATNAVVIGANGGMPVSASALEIARVGPPAQLEGGGALKHHLMGPDDVLTPLADVIGVPPPVAAIVSVGDVLLYAGVYALVVSVMLGRSGENRRPPPRWFQGYRGKHLRSERRLALAGLPKPARRPAGDPWGT